MKKYCVSMLFCFFASLLSACVTHELENPFIPPSEPQEPQKPEVLPPGSGTWQKTADQYDGHYNMAYKITSCSCGDEYSRDPLYRVWNFISKDKGGVIMFDEDFFWIDLPVELDNQGKFSQKWTSIPTLFMYSLWAFTIKIDGQIKDGLFSANITEIILTGKVPEAGNAPEMKPACTMTYEAAGYRRYRPDTGSSKNIEGEYKSRIVKNYSTCKFRTFYDDFGVIIIPQDENNNVSIDWLDINNLPINDGIIDATATGLKDTYTFQGKIDSKSLDLRLTLAYGDPFYCSEDYAIHGEKRFEEADGNDTTIDGLFIVQMSPGDATCQMENFNWARRLLDSIKMDGNKTRLVLGGRKFMAEIDAQNNFSATLKGDNDFYKTVHTFSGNIDANAISGTLTTSFDWPEIMKCYYSYEINGYKLYKHN